MTSYDEFYSKADYRYPSLENGIKNLSFQLSVGSRFHVSSKDRILRVFDLGCGTGYWSSVFKEMGHQVLGLDNSRVAIRGAKEKRGKEIAFILGDARNLGLREGSFDVIFVKGLSLFNTHDLEDIRRLTNYLLGFLDEGGAIILISRSDLSGIKKGAWVNHTLENLSSLFTDSNYRTHGPYFYSATLMSALYPRNFEHLRKAFLLFMSSVLKGIGSLHLVRIPYFFVLTKISGRKNSD